MADEAGVEEGVSPAQNPLLSVTFQRNIHRKKKYLEAEPKALGITQIGLSLYKIISLGVFHTKGQTYSSSDVPFFILSLLVVVAGIVAVAAQNLNLSTLKACLGMQIMACVASIINLIITLFKMGEWLDYCWRYQYFETNSTVNNGEICEQVQSIRSHFFAVGVLIQATLLAISVTLAAYCCKVVNCCGPAPKMPVITVQTPQQPLSSTAEADQTATED